MATGTEWLSPADQEERADFPHSRKTRPKPIPESDIFPIAEELDHLLVDVQEYR